MGTKNDVLKLFQLYDKQAFKYANSRKLNKPSVAMHCSKNENMGGNLENAQH